MTSFFTNIRETFSALTEATITKGDSKTFGARTVGTGVKQPVSKLEATARIIITIILIGVAVFLLNGDTSSQLASGIIGAVMGYWFK